MLSSVFPFIYAFVLIVLLWQALKIMFRGYSAANACDIALRNMTSGPANVSEAQSQQQMQELERKLDELEGKTPRYLNV